MMFIAKFVKSGTQQGEVKMGLGLFGNENGGGGREIWKVPNLENTVKYS